MSAEPCILLAGGGTGGHVFPMIAVAEALKRAAPKLRVVFVGTRRGLEARLVPAAGYELEFMSVAPILGGGLKTAWRGTLRALRALPEAQALLKKFDPAVVFSVGGYAAGPISLAARMAARPVALLEPNTVPGLANRLMAPWVQRAYTAFSETERHFNASKIRRTGVPLRQDFVATDYARTPGRLRVLVLGGSQGARSLNEAVPEACVLAQAPLEVVHQTGPADAEAVAARYRPLGERARVVPFIDDMAQALRDADLVIGRAGASAVSEICAVGRPAILIPFPFAAGDHQTLNAQALVAAGAALCLATADASSARLAQEIDALAQSPGRLELMAARARERGRPRAAHDIADDLLKLASSRWVRSGSHAAMLCCSEGA